MTTLVKIHLSELAVAFHKWFDLHYGLQCEEVFDRYYKFVDPELKNPTTLDPEYTYDVDDPDNDYMDEEGFIKILPECAERVKMLAGPNAFSILQAWYVKNPWK